MLTARLGTRGVTVLRGTPAHDLVVREGRVAGVMTATGTLDADVVVCAVDPRLLPTLAPYVVRTMPAIPPVVVHLGLTADVPDVGHELVLHGDPMIVVRAGGQRPGRPRGLDPARPRPTGRGHRDGTGTAPHRRPRPGGRPGRPVAPRPGRGPGGRAMGVLWQGRGTVRQRLGPTTPVPGVYAVGAHATPGGQVPFVGLSAALVAELVGPA